MLKKDDIIERLVAKGYTKRGAWIAVKDIFDVIAEAMVEGEDVQVHGFGTFEVKTHSSRESVAVNTQDKIVIPEYRYPKFTPGKLLKRSIREGFYRK